MTEVAHQGRALDRALEPAEHIASLPAMAVSAAKQAIDAMPDASREAGPAVERLPNGLRAQSEDARQAADAFTEKRASRFRVR